MRAIAAEAGVDPALVHHYFGTKDDLFMAALQLPVDPRVVLAPVFEGGVDGAGERLAAGLPLASGTTRRPGCRCSAWSAAWSTPRAGCSCAKGFVRVILGPVGQALGTRRARAPDRPVASQMIGLVMLRYVLEAEPLASMDTEVLVATYAPTLQRYLDGDLPPVS